MNQHQCPAVDGEHSGAPAYRGACTLSVPFPALARGAAGDGTPFEEASTLDHLHAHGLTMRLSVAPPQGAPLFVVVRIALGRRAYEPGLCIAVRGRVVITLPRLDGSYAVTVAFSHYRFIFAGGTI